MLLVVGALAGLLAGILSGGSLRSLTGLRFRQAWVVPVALVLKEATVIVAPIAFSGTAPLLFTVTLAALAAWTLWHRDLLPGLAVVAAGMVLNLAAVLANGGRMPVTPELAAAGFPELRTEGHYGPYLLAGAATRLDWLGDWLQLPGGLGRVLPFAYSPGDLVALAGIVLSGFQAVRRGRRDPARN